jgi:hypothetical protein
MDNIFERMREQTAEEKQRNRKRNKGGGQKREERA